MIKQNNYSQLCKQKVSSLLQEAIADGVDTNPKFLFDEVWRKLFVDSEMMLNLSKIRGGIFEQFQLNFKERLHLLITLRLRELGINFLSNVVVRGHNHFQSIVESKNTSLVLSVHDGYAFASSALLGLGQRVSIITSDPYIGNTLWRCGVRPDQVELITNDFRSLERLIRSMAQGITSTNCVDYQNSDGIYELISPTLFNLAIKKNIPTFFMKREVGDDGSIHLETAALTSTSDALADAKLFVDFQMSKNYNPDRHYVVKH